MTARLTRTLIDGKARYNGRSLSEWVPEVVDAIVARFAPSQVVLFGSVERGDDGPDSDIDLLVVLPATSRSERSRMMGELIATASVGPPVDVIATEPEEYEASSRVPGLLRVAAREGRVVYERSS